MSRRSLFSDTADVRQRHAALLQGSPRQRMITVGTLALIIGLAIFAVLRLEFSFARLGSGIVQLGTFLGLMVPPSPGTQLWAFLHALAETVAIAFLGTLLAAILSFRSASSRRGT